MSATEHRGEQHVEEGSCSLCEAAAERSSNGAWWHTDGPCSSQQPSRTAHFRPAPRQQNEPPRDRQIRHPGRDR
ncbi:hypothetical protein [Streptomyces sp. NBC_00827]|uniref:hypothetical protein n=1 Tax=Streptomyces sp. NBC_00827 TaxID=2903677 RepID=UPI0038679168|nr:hypothetical protein OG569_02190 [Streptomyces sp. NBC_00827]